MFRRLTVTETMNDLALGAFLVFLVIFISIAIWALRLPRERVRHMSELPLESESHDDESNS